MALERGRVIERRVGVIVRVSGVKEKDYSVVLGEGGWEGRVL